MQGRAVGDREARRLVEREALGDSRQPVGRDRDPFPRRPIAAEAHDLIADRKPLRALPQRDDAAGELSAGRKGRRRFDLIFALDDQRVEEVKPGVRHLDHRFAVAGRGRLDLDQPQIFGRTKRRTDQGFHERLPILLIFQ